MLFRLYKQPVAKIKHWIIRRSCHNSKSKSSSIRNIGILAHIDAGKTTTTERMLFYAGKTQTLGEVHHGNTVTDFLKQERDRGITICSSAVSFDWKEHRVNLLDTPGHIDFTMEVEQSLAAVDGAVVVLDSSAGVEAQTVTVWNQTERHELPRMVFCNKMDRRDADFDSCLLDLKRKLDVIPIPIQIPIHDKAGGLKFIIDLVQKKQLFFDIENLGKSYKVSPVDDQYATLVQEKRSQLIDTISSLNDNLAETIIANESLESVSVEQLMEAIRAICISRKAVPVLLGSAYKNTGVQPLLDAILNFFPAPFERNKIYDCFGDDFVGKVFKVMHDKQRGPLSLVRVYRGQLKKGSKVTTSRGGNEQITRIYEPLADEYKDINVVNGGNIGVCAGLKLTNTGDILVTGMSTLQRAQKRLEAKKVTKSVQEDDNNEINEELLNSAFSLEPKIPEAVYFCSIEPPSQAYQTALEVALKQIQREDPSLRVRYDETTAQTVLGGMGELHLEIVRSRILTEYKIEADLGPLQIAYKETLESAARERLQFEKEIAGSKQNVTIELSVKNKKHSKHDDDFRLDTTQDAAELLATVRPKFIQLAKKGALAALNRGPRLGSPVIDVQITLHFLQVGRGTADSFIMAAASQCVQKILNTSDCHLLEPIMELQIILPSERVSTIVSDLARRRAVIQDVAPKGEQNKIIYALAPLAELTGYSTTVRTISSGTASIIMAPHSYAAMSQQDESVAIQKAQGLL